MHGKDPLVTWTQLVQTAKAGQNFLMLDSSVDISNWQEGDEIVVTSTALTSRNYTHPSESLDETE